MKEPRYDVILRVLTSPQPVRRLLAYEQRGPLVQLLASGTTDPTWQAPPRLLADAIHKAVALSEEWAVPSRAQPVETPAAPHDLVIECRGLDLVGTCRCGQVLGRITPGTRLDALAVPWERHTAALAAAV